MTDTSGKMKQDGDRNSNQWVWLFLVGLAFLLVWGVITTQYLPVAPIQAYQPENHTYQNFAVGWANREIGRKLLSPWLRWDSVWYLSIARDGYQSDLVSVAYPPLYPMLIRLIGRMLGGQYLVGALLLSWGTAFGACGLLAKRALDHGQNPGKVIRALLLFPTAFFLFSGYTESLFLLLALLAWREAERGRWWWVGLLGTIAVLTRFMAVFLLVPFGLIWLGQFRRREISFWSGLWLTPIPLAYFGWGWYVGRTFGLQPSAALHQGWALHFDWPWVGFIGSLKAVFTQPISEVFYAYIDILAVLIVAWAIVSLLRNKKAPEGMFVLTVLLIALMKVSDRGVLGSTARYLMPLFPIYLIQPKWLSHPVWGRVALYGSLLLWLFCSAMFFTWNWIS